MANDMTLNLQEQILRDAETYPFEVFLCGPSFSAYKPSAVLRYRLQHKLENQGFTVVLGEDKGIDELFEKGYLFIEQRLFLTYQQRKTRIISFNARQVVTGLVVNEKVQPLRYKRRQIRAAFHNASFKDKIDAEELNRLRGYYGYLYSATDSKDSKSLARYKEISSTLSQKCNGYSIWGVGGAQPGALPLSFCSTRQ